MHKLKHITEAVGGLICALALFAIMALTFFDVGGRKLLSQSIPGSLELTEILMVAVIFAGLPLVSLRGEHVLFDSLDSLLPKGLVQVQKRLVHLLMALAMGMVAWLLADKAAQMITAGDITSQLKIAQGPFVYFMAAMCALATVVHLGLMCTGDIEDHHNELSDV
jgi:TRAP-type transport system small permease protein